RPAEGVRVRLLYGRQFVVAASRTDQSGRCVHTVAQPGAYEAIIETGSASDENLRISFSVMDEVKRAGFPWFAAVLGFGAIFGATVLVATRRTKSTVVASPRWRGLLAGTAFLAACGGIWSWSTWRHGQAAAAPGPSIATEARDFLRSQKVQPLSGPLERILAEAAGNANHVGTQPHPLLGQSAPDFSLLNVNGQPMRLQEQCSRGPVVLIFYYG